MPCTYEESQYDRDVKALKKYAKDTTALMCELMEIYESQGVISITNMPAKAVVWWEDHKRVDREREDKARREEERKKQEAIQRVQSAIENARKLGVEI